MSLEITLTVPLNVKKKLKAERRPKKYLALEKKCTLRFVMNAGLALTKFQVTSFLSLPALNASLPVNNNIDNDGNNNDNDIIIMIMIVMTNDSNYSNEENDRNDRNGSRNVSRN